MKYSKQRNPKRSLKNKKITKSETFHPPPYGLQPYGKIFTNAYSQAREGGGPPLLFCPLTVSLTVKYSFLFLTEVDCTKIGVN